MAYLCASFIIHACSAAAHNDRIHWYSPNLEREKVWKLKPVDWIEQAMEIREQALNTELKEYLKQINRQQQ
jgi:hypothetical protein